MNLKNRKSIACALVLSAVMLIPAIVTSATTSNSNTVNIPKIANSAKVEKVSDNVKKEMIVETKEDNSVIMKNSEEDREQAKINLEKEKEKEAEKNKQVNYTASSSNKSSSAEYSLSDLQFHGVINWGGYKFTYYSQQVLPGGGLNIPGRHVNSAGYVCDGDGYIVIANDAPKGTVFNTPFGGPGKVYDRGTYGNHLDVYTK